MRSAVEIPCVEAGEDVKITALPGRSQAPDAKADNVQQAVSMAKPGKMYANSDLKSAVVRDLDPGMMLYPTGDKMGVWWKVTDELGNAGWVVSTNFKLAH
jgi:hypothetical protein